MRGSTSSTVTRLARMLLSAVAATAVATSVAFAPPVLAAPSATPSVAVVGGTMGGVTRTSDTTPVRGVIVTALLLDADGGPVDAWSVTSAADGTWALSGLPAGSYRVCGSSTTLIERCAAFPTVVTDGQPTTVADLVYQVRPADIRIALTGKDRVRWAWDAVPGATNYRVAVSTSPKMTNARIRNVRTTWATFTGLKRGTYYVAAVRAQDVGSLTLPSKKVTARAGAVTKPVGTFPEETDAIDWSWTPYHGAARYEVRQAWTRDFSHGVTGYPTTTTIRISAERDSGFWCKVRALDSAGRAISSWSMATAIITPYHPVVDDLP